MYCVTRCYFLLFLLLVQQSPWVTDALVVGAPSKLTVGSGYGEGLKPSKLLVIISHPGTAPVHVLSHEHVSSHVLHGDHVVSHDHVVTGHDHVLDTSAPHAAIATASHVSTPGVATAVSTTSLQVHTSDPAETAVTHTLTQISHPASVSAVPVVSPHHHAIPHPASTVNGHSLGYGSTDVFKHFNPALGPHENLYTVHVGGFGVGLHYGGHGHGHGYFAVL